MKKKTTPLKWLIGFLIIPFLGMNLVSYFHAFKFTHFSEKVNKKTIKPSQMSFKDKVSTLIFGVDNPKPVNVSVPNRKYSTIKLKSNVEIECWDIKVDSSKGTVIMFHGYGGTKSSLLDKSDIFNAIGYNTMIVDFMGSGNSEGTQTTIGYLEAEQVKSCYDYLVNNKEKNIYLFGTSMGAVAVMKAINDFSVKPNGILIECPFGSMYKTVVARFDIMGVPSFPMANLLVFWGGLQNGFWAFGHNPIDYAKNINCPTLLMYGEQDKKVSNQEITDIYNNLTSTKELKTYPLAGHENYLLKYSQQWKKDVESFLKKNK